MRVAFIQHADFEDPGAIVEWAALRGHATHTTVASTGAFPSPDAYDLLVVMGGPMGANDDARYPWLAAEKAAVRAAVDAGSRVLGVCLGAQILASVLGAEVSRNPEPEIGWFPVRLSAQGRASRVFGALPEEFVAGQWHGDTFGIPAGAVRTAESDACVNQAFEYDAGRVVGVQFHIEWTAASAQALVEQCSADLVPGAYVVSEAEFIAGEAAYGAASRTMLFALLDALVA